jgi:hypothetical protein
LFQACSFSSEESVKEEMDSAKTSSWLSDKDLFISV